MKEIFFLFASVFSSFGHFKALTSSTRKRSYNRFLHGKMTMKNEITNKRTHQSECSRWQFGSRKTLVPVFRAVSGEY